LNNHKRSEPWIPVFTGMTDMGQNFIEKAIQRYLKLPRSVIPDTDPGSHPRAAQALRRVKDRWVSEV
jgi:hypothetical protein